MKQKNIFTVILSIILLFSLSYSKVLANEDQKTNSNLGNTVSESMHKTEEAGKNVWNAVTNDHNQNNNNNNNNNQNVGDKMRDGVNSVANTVENGVRNVANAGYNTARTAADTTATTNTSTIWTWVVLLAVGAAIIALVWYFAMQNSNNDR